MHSGTESARPEIEAALLTCREDHHYAFGPAMGLVAKGADLDFFGDDEMDSPRGLTCDSS